MNIPQPHINIRVREIFRRIYINRKINLKASKESLKDQLDFYLDHLGNHISHSVLESGRKRIWAIIERNNQVSKILESRSNRRILKRMKELLGPSTAGFVFCIDGRIPAIFLGGRFARHFEVPAGEITTTRRKSDNKLIPDSSDLIEALRRITTSGDELLEIIFAHTSLSDKHHGCGAMMAKRKMGLIDLKLPLEEANLEIIKNKTIPAITNIYNGFRSHIGLEPLNVVGLPALYDTDTFGMILNYDLGEKSLSTTDLTNKFQDLMDDYFIKSNLFFGCFKEKFSDLKYQSAFSQNVLVIIEAILSSKVAPNLLLEIESYLSEYYADLTVAQRQALRFILIRKIAFQYLTGLASNKRKYTDHPFFAHGESYMAVAMRGATIGKFDPQNQAFASTPADPKQAISNINTMLSILGDSPKMKPYILFVCNSVNSRDLKENNIVLQRIMGSNAGLFEKLIADKNLGEMIEKGDMIPIPILIEENSREVLKIIDNSVYI